MEAVKILTHLASVERDVKASADFSEDVINILNFVDYVRYENGMEIWTDALQKAITEHSVTFIPKKETPYYIDKSVLIPSERRIEADKAARIVLTPDRDVLMMRNTETRDGTHFPISDDAPKSGICRSARKYKKCCTRKHQV